MQPYKKKFKMPMVLVYEFITNKQNWRVNGKRWKLVSFHFEMLSKSWKSPQIVPYLPFSFSPSYNQKQYHNKLQSDLEKIEKPNWTLQG